MQLLSDDDGNLAEMSEAELAAAFELWFELAAATDPYDPPYTHGVFQSVDLELLRSSLVSGSRTEASDDDPRRPASARAST